MIISRQRKIRRKVKGIAMTEKLRENKDVLIASAIFAAGIALSVIMDMILVVPLALGYVCYASVAKARGHSLASIARMSRDGAKESMVVVGTLFLIGAVSAVWRASGTIAIFVKYGLGLITPHLFLLLVFLICCVFSYALGSCFGVAGTIGIIFVTMAKAGDVSALMTAGAVLSGGYFGDRCSPVSASASLTAFVTKTDLYTNVKLMAKTMTVPVAITTVMYAMLSVTHPLKTVDPAISEMISKGFDLSPLLLVPAAVMLVLPLFKVNIKITAFVSIAAAFVLAVIYQGADPLALTKSLVLGYEAEGAALSRIFTGGGMISMANVCGVVFISCAYAQIIKETGMFRDLFHLMCSGCSKVGRVYMTFILGTCFSGLFCSGSAAIIMSSMMLDDAYEKTGGSRQELAIDIENTAELTATWVPWSTACMAAFSVMAIQSTALVYSFFVFVLPVYYMLRKTFARRKNSWYNKLVHVAENM